MCCSPHRLAIRAATQYHTQAWQMLIQRKECFIILLILAYVVFIHKFVKPCGNLCLPPVRSLHPSEHFACLPVEGNILTLTQDSSSHLV